MKKFMFVAIAGLFVFASCGNKAKEVTTETEEVTQVDTKCCKELTEEQKADCAAWKDWDNQTPERKQELVNKKKECIDKCMAEKEAKCAESKEACTKTDEEKAKCAEFKAKWDAFATLTVDEQKALIDEIKCCKESKKCCKEEGENACEKK